MTVHSFTPGADGHCLYCGKPKSHPNHAESWAQDAPIAFTLTSRGWCEAMGISSAVQEAIGVDLD